MKPFPTKSIFSAVRCSYRTPAGRQCQLLASHAPSGLCSQHRSAQQQSQGSDVSFTLAGQSQAFQTAQGINHSLGALYRLLAENRISARRAAVLAYISSLLLRTLPQIDADRDAGIIDPTEPQAKPLPVSVADEGADSDSDSQTDPDLDSGSDSESDTDSDPVPAPVGAWDPAIPEPDPKKKPS